VATCRTIHNPQDRGILEEVRKVDKRGTREDVRAEGWQPIEPFITLRIEEYWKK
jgi:hypothetical protein